MHGSTAARSNLPFLGEFFQRDDVKVPVRLPVEHFSDIRGDLAEGVEDVGDGGGGGGGAGGHLSH